MTLLGFLAVLGSVALGSAAYAITATLTWDIIRALYVGAGVTAIGVVLTFMFL